jgi:hypothetical protein
VLAVVAVIGHGRGFSGAGELGALRRRALQASVLTTLPSSTYVAPQSQRRRPWCLPRRGGGGSSG